MPKESRTKVGRVLSAARYAAFMAHSAVASAPPRRPGVCVAVVLLWLRSWRL